VTKDAIFDRYIFKDLIVATVFVAVVLALVILLTESLKFLELIINSGASSGSFWILTLLSMPRFFEIILPIATMAATIFVYNRMTMDSELIVMRATGFSPLRLARPALMLSLVTSRVLLFTTVWRTPVSVSNMEVLREEIKAQFSTLLFREGVFNPVGPGLTIYIRERASSGELHGLMIHDSRAQNKTPVTIVARRGKLEIGDKGQQVVVFDGSRQQINPGTNTLTQLDFDRYTIDLPDGSGPAQQHWRGPEERSLRELTHLDPQDAADKGLRREFRMEYNRRLATPLLTFSFTSMALALLLAGHLDRRGQGRRIAAAVICAVLIQGLYMASLNIARHSSFGLILMYIDIAAPIAVSLYFLAGRTEALRRHWLRLMGSLRS
jgi:lipopolysaccharide export system permease protein